MMKRTTILFVAGTVAALAAAADRTADIPIRLHVMGLVLGEFTMGAGEHFEMVVENDGSTPVKLTTAPLGYPASAHWKVHIEGPVDKRCSAYRMNPPAVGSPVAGSEAEHILIEPGASKVLPLALEDVGAPGDYRVSVEYNGEDPPGVDPALRPRPQHFRGHLRSDTVTFTINQALGIDAQILGRWRERNPDKPWCAYPQGMDTDIRIPQVLLKEYPTSTFAAYLAAKPGDFVTSSVDPGCLLDAIASGAYPAWNSVPDFGGPNKWQSLEGPKMAEWRRKWFGAILDGHPEAWFADEFRLRMALDDFALHGSTKELQGLAKKAADRVQVRAKEYLALMVQRGMIEGDSLEAELAAKLPAVKGSDAKDPVLREK